MEACLGSLSFATPEIGWAGSASHRGNDRGSAVVDRARSVTVRKIKSCLSCIIAVLGGEDTDQLLVYRCDRRLWFYIYLPESTVIFHDRRAGQGFINNTYTEAQGSHSHMILPMVNTSQKDEAAS